MTEIVIAGTESDIVIFIDDKNVVTIEEKLRGRPLPKASVRIGWTAAGSDISCKGSTISVLRTNGGSVRIEEVKGGIGIVRGKGTGVVRQSALTEQK